MSRHLQSLLTLEKKNNFFLILLAGLIVLLARFFLLFFSFFLADFLFYYSLGLFHFTFSLRQLNYSYTTYSGLLSNCLYWDCVCCEMLLNGTTQSVQMLTAAACYDCCCQMPIMMMSKHNDKFICEPVSSEARHSIEKNQHHLKKAS